MRHACAPPTLRRTILNMDVCVYYSITMTRIQCCATEKCNKYTQEYKETPNQKSIFSLHWKRNTICAGYMNRTHTYITMTSQFKYRLLQKVIYNYRVKFPARQFPAQARFLGTDPIKTKRLINIINNIFKNTFVKLVVYHSHKAIMI